MKERIVERRMYRIGQIVPSSNTTMETEIPAMLHARARIRPERFTFHSSRMRMHKVTREELAVMNRAGLRCATELADARVDVMSTACLVAIMAMGAGYHREVERELTEVARANHCAAPVMTSAGALIEGLRIHWRQKDCAPRSLHALVDRPRRAVHRGRRH
jgi:maleate isomerase